MSDRRSHRPKTPRELSKERQAFRGRLLCLMGVVLLVMHGIEAVYGIPGMPRFWHQNRHLWLTFNLVVIAIGTSQLWQSEPDDSGGLQWKPSRSGRRFKKIILYTRSNCGLCEEAEEIFHDYDKWLPMPIKVDIDTDSQLSQKYGECIPVVECDGKVRFKGRVDETLLRRLIEGTPPIPWP